jgi:DNA-binding MarR family transcriptional regulator
MSEQLTFDSLAAREVRRARRTDPQTSKDAARDSHGLAAEHELLILQVLRDGRDRDWTPHEIAERCGLNSVQVTRRLHDLWASGRIAESWLDEQDRVQALRATPSGRRARCWRFAP